VTSHGSNENHYLFCMIFISGYHTKIQLSNISPYGDIVP